MKIETYSENETYTLGRKLAQLAVPGEIICLDGDLGAGKTVFSKGFAEGLGICEPVTSPTFNIVKEYEEGRLKLNHFDVYRISDPDEMYAIGCDEYFFGDGVCLIEWSDLIREILPEEVLRIVIRRVPEKGFDYRLIEITGPEEKIKELENV